MPSPPNSEGKRDAPIPEDEYLRRENERLEAEVATLKRIAEEYRMPLGKAQAEAGRERKQRQATEREVERLEVEISAKEQVWDHANAEVERLKREPPLSEMNELLRRAFEAEVERDEARAEVERLTKELTLTQEELIRTQAERGGLREAIERHRAKSRSTAADSQLEADRELWAALAKGES